MIRRLVAPVCVVALLAASCGPTVYQTPVPAVNGTPQPDTTAVTTPPVPPTNSGAFTDIATKAANGLAAALADANAHKDTISAACWRYLQPIAQALATGQPVNGFTPAGRPIDFFSGIQAIRDARTFIAGGIPDAFYLACGPLMLQQNITTAQVLNNVGITAALNAAKGL